jgi:hypothetical protein
MLAVGFVFLAAPLRAQFSYVAKILPISDPRW